MSQEDLKTLLEKLHAELSNTDSLDADTQTLLGTVVQDIHAVLGDEPQDDSPQGLVNRLKDATDEFEEINSEEVDRVVEALDRLIAGVQSENIKHYLEEAASNIYYLVYEVEVDETDDGVTEAA